MTCIEGIGLRAHNTTTIVCSIVKFNWEDLHGHLMSMRDIHFDNQ